jgi:serine/threonine protein kinase
MSYLSDKIDLIEKLGEGSFGEVYLAQTKKGKKVAAKVEEKKGSSRLQEEYNIYKKLKQNENCEGIPKIYKFIDTPQFNILVMQLLGKSLDELFNENGKKFDIGTTLKLGVDIITVLEGIHNAGFIHRDIKPNNFMIGHGSDYDKLYVIDFGLSKQYMIKNKHIALREERSLVGTARYTSINVHMGIEPSRRDDLESVGYMLVYFLLGSLPWQGLKKRSEDKKQDKKDKYQLIGDKKMCTSPKMLCKGLPHCFEQYLIYCQNLNFDEEPDYDYMRSLFEQSSEDTNNDLNYFWVQ